MEVAPTPAVFPALSWTMLHHRRVDRHRRDVFRRVPAEPRGRDERLNRLCREREDDECVRAGRLQLRDLRRDGDVGHDVALGPHDLPGVRAEPALQPGEQLLPVLVVLVEDADLRVRVALGDETPVDGSFALEARQQPHRPRRLRVLVADRGRAAADEQLRHLLLVEVARDCDRLLRADRVEDREDVVALDELLRLRDRLRRVVLVVLELVDDLPPVDAAVGVDVGEVRLRSGQDRLVRRLGAGERAGAAEEDLRRRHAGGGRVTRARGGHGEQRGRDRENGQRADHRETAFCRTESLSVIRPIVIDEPGWTSSR